MFLIFNFYAQFGDGLIINRNVYIKLISRILIIVFDGGEIHIIQSLYLFIPARRINHVCNKREK